MYGPLFLLLLEITVPDSKLGIRHRGKDKVGRERQHRERKTRSARKDKGGR
jgi:hypothetical protein